MRDWKQLVRERLATLNLPSNAKEEVVAELAAHLEDSASMDPETTESENRALARIPWHKLLRAIERTKREEEEMNRRTKTLWLPSIAVLFTIGLILLFLGRAPFWQGFIWIACMALLLCTVASEANHLNRRTRSLWLPALANLAAASLFTLVLTKISLLPRFVEGLNSGTGRWLYLVWLFSCPLFGALGAFLSRRAGGSRFARVAAGTFPAIAMFVLCMVAIPISALFEPNAFVLHHPSAVALGVLLWAGGPGIALFAGTAPFLKELRLQHS